MGRDIRSHQYTCVGKKVFHSSSVADNAAYLLNLSRGDNLEGYFCTACFKHHVGHGAGSVDRATRVRSFERRAARARLVDNQC